jgi:hypothetical protein
LQNFLTRKSEEQGWILINRWTHIVFDFTVQNSYIADPAGGYSAGSNVVPVGFIPWFAGQSMTNTLENTGHYTETGIVWVADTELYINP